MKHKVLYIKLLVFLFITISFMVNISCTQKTSSVQTNNEYTTNEKIVLKWMIYGEKSKNSESVFSEFNKKLQEYYPDTTVEFDIVPYDIYKEKWDMKMATNEHLDLAWIGNDIFNYTEEVKKVPLWLWTIY